MKLYAVMVLLFVGLYCATAVTGEINTAPPQSQDKEKDTERNKKQDYNQETSFPEGAWRDIPMGFDKYPKRSYKFLFNNVLSNILYKPGEATSLVPVPAGTIPSALTFESGYSMVERLSNYPVNLLYDKIGTGWTSLIMLIKATLLDFPFAYTMKVFNHEFSGHTVRIYESGRTIEKIKIGVPLPWGRGGGSTLGYMTQSIDKTIFISTAGSEANTVLAHEMALRFVSDRVIYPFDILLYLNARFDQLLYINNATKNPSGFRIDINGDYQEYIVLINNKYGRVLPNTYRLKLDELKRWSYIALADPFLYMATGAFFYNMFTGKQYMKTWMIPLGKAAKIMPSARVVYTPNGPECYGDLFLNLPRHTVLLIYGTGGSKTLRRTWGGGVRLYSVDLGRFAEIGGGFDLFSQPRVMNYTSTYYLENIFWNRPQYFNPIEQYGLLTSMDLLYGYMARAVKRVYGVAGYADVTFKVGEVFRAYIRMGYKSRGYVFGMKLTKGFFWHTGVGFNF